MATREQLVSALRQADSTGDFEAAKRFAELLKDSPSAPVEKQEYLTPTALDINPFPMEPDETRAAKELPELGQMWGTDDIEPQGLLSNEDQSKVAAISPALLTATNPEEASKILSSNFPHIGIIYDAGGNMIAVNNKTGVRNIINRPNMSQRDFMQLIGIGAAMFPSGKASGLLSKGAPMMQKAAAGAGAAGLTQAGIEGVHSLSGGDVDKTDIALSAGLGAGAEYVAPLLQKFKDTRAAKGIVAAKDEIKKALESVKPSEKAVNAIKQATGVDVGLFQAQKTLLPSALVKQRLLPQLDAGSRTAAEALEAQNKEVFEATSELIEKIAPSTALEGGAGRFRDAAKLAVDAGREKRKAATKDLYEEALSAGADVDLTPVKALVKDVLADAPTGGKFSTSIKKVANLIKPKKKGEAPTLRQLQLAKQEMDDIIGSFGDASVTNSAKREILNIRTILAKQMGEASHLYANADEVFASMTPSVKALEDSVIGKISNVSDVELKSIAGKIFDPREVNPEVVKRSKRLIDKVDPNAWDELMRVELQRRFGGLKEMVSESPSDLVGNVPSQLRRAIFGNPEKRRVLLAGMNPAQRENFKYLDEVLRRAGAGRAAGSPTEANRQATEKLRGTAVVLRDMIFRPLESIKSVGEASIFDRNVAKLTEILFDPKWAPKLKEIKNSNPSKAEKLMRELFDSAKLKAGAQGELQTEGGAI
jgi:hypothetical protein